MRRIKVACCQLQLNNSMDVNINKAIDYVKKAAANGAKVILLPELFQTPYFCKLEKYEYFEYAKKIAEADILAIFQKLAAELAVCLPISFFEQDRNNFYNSLAMIDADGTILGVYRKAHIPDGPGYEEKFYFTPGDTPFTVWNTKYGKIGVGVCWDQWFPECARIMALKGAEVLLYPTAIGSEPRSEVDTMGHWQRTMQGHSAANIMPLLAANRIGEEKDDDMQITFYGSSFITDQFGEIKAVASRTEQTILYQEFDLEAIAKDRCLWGVFRDRRIDLYDDLLKRNPK